MLTYVESTITVVMMVAYNKSLQRALDPDLTLLVRCGGVRASAGEISR